MVLLALVACSTGEPRVEPPPAAPPVEASRLDETWVLRLVPEAEVGPYATEEGWVTLVMKRDLPGAVRQLGPLGGPAAARAHAEAAALFRQAARLAGESYVQTYHGPSAQPSDPAGTAHLVSVGLGLRGDRAGAARASERAAALTRDPTALWHGPWASWLRSGAPWPPDLAGLPLDLPAPTPGLWPTVPPGPQYQLVEDSAARAKRALGDPLVLVELGEWHEQAAVRAAPELSAAIRRLRFAYGLSDQAPPEADEVPLPLLFGSDHLTAGDVDFLVAARLAGSPDAVRAAIAAHAPTSIVASLAQGALVDGLVEPARATDAAEALRAALVDRAAQARGGSEQGQDVQFARIAHVGVLRSLGLVAEGLGDRERSGRLLIAAWDASDGPTADPVGQLWFATWDVANRYPVRAAQTIHQLSSHIDELSPARLAVDVLNLRVNRENVGQPPN